MYNPTSKCAKVKDARGTYLHAREEKPFFNIPRGLRIKRATAVKFLGAISQCTRQWGWEKVTQNMKTPLWMTIPQPSHSSQELLKCNCKSEKGCTGHCKCVKALVSVHGNEHKIVRKKWWYPCIINKIVFSWRSVYDVFLFFVFNTFILFVSNHYDLYQLLFGLKL